MEDVKEVINEKLRTLPRVSFVTSDADGQREL